MRYTEFLRLDLVFLISYCVVKHWKGNWDDVLFVILDLAIELIYLAFILVGLVLIAEFKISGDWYKGTYSTWCCYPRPLAIVIATHWSPNPRYFHLSSVNSLFLLNFICIKIQKIQKLFVTPVFISLMHTFHSPHISPL